MSKVLIVFLCITIFAIGLSVGIYSAMKQPDEDVIDKTELARQIQDIVIEQVQASQHEKEDAEETNADVVIKISPYAKLIVEKHFTKCGHTTIDIIDIPKELINYTEDEFRKKYDKWEIKSFDSKEISIYRDIDANCSSHFVIKEDDGYLAIFSEITDDVLELKERTDIEVAGLRDEDRLALQDGIKVYGNVELSALLEDFNS